MADESQRASALHAQGKTYFDAASSDHEHAAIFKPDLASALQMVRRYDEAVSLYEQSSGDQGELESFASNELAELQERRRQWLVPMDGPHLTSDDERLLKIAAPMIAKYPAIVHPYTYDVG